MSDEYSEKELALGFSRAVTRRSALRGLLTGAAVIGSAPLLGACADKKGTGAVGSSSAGSAAATPGSASSAASSAATSSSAVATSSSAAVTEAKLTYWSNHPEWKAASEKIWDGYTAKNPGVEVTTDAKPGDAYNPAVQAALASDTLPDLVGLNTVDLRAAADAGKLVDLTADVDVTRLVAATVPSLKHKDKVWAIPFASYTVGIAYNKEMFAKHGLQPPKTTQELLDLCQKLKDLKETPIMFGGKEGPHHVFTYAMAVASAAQDEDIVEKLNTGERKLTDPDLLKAVEFMKSLEPFFQKGYLGTGYTQAKADFANGRAAMMTSGSADHTGFKLVNPKFDDGVFAFPPFEAGGKDAVVTGNENVIAVAANSKNVDAAKAAALYLLTDEAQQAIADTISQPVVKGIGSQKDPVQGDYANVGALDVRPFYELDNLGGVFDAYTVASSAMYAGKKTPAQVAEDAQKAVTPPK